LNFSFTHIIIILQNLPCGKPQGILKLIKAKEVPIRYYNYTYIKDILENNYNQKASLSTIINRAKTNGFYLTKPKRKVHEKEVITNYPGELIQHDSSHHLFTPYADSKWYLITSLDDYSRLILYAVLVERENTWEHILALEAVLMNDPAACRRVIHFLKSGFSESLFLYNFFKAFYSIRKKIFIC